MSASRDAREFQGSVFFQAGTPEGKRWTADLPLQSWIGRSLRLSDEVKPEPVYRLDLTPEASKAGALPGTFNKAGATVRLTLELQIKPGIGEGLAVIPGSVQLFCDGKALEVDATHLVRLRLCTLVDDTFWLDAPSFEVDAVRLFAGN